MAEVFEAYRYAADGHTGEVDPADPTRSDRAVLACGTLGECRAAVQSRLAVVWGEPLTSVDFEASRWSGLDGDVEAYHDSFDAEECGGWAIRRAR